jgi:hypothetical protein
MYNLWPILTGLVTAPAVTRKKAPWMPAKAGMARIFAPHSFAARAA